MRGAKFLWQRASSDFFFFSLMNGRSFTVNRGCGFAASLIFGCRARILPRRRSKYVERGLFLICVVI